MKELNGSQIDYSKPKLKFYQNYVVVDNESKKIISDDNL